MRNINFDESTVLNEYARIASEKQLLKGADELEKVAATNIQAYVKKMIPTMIDWNDLRKGSTGGTLLRLKNWAAKNYHVDNASAIYTALVDGTYNFLLTKYPQSKQALDSLRSQALEDVKTINTYQAEKSKMSKADVQLGLPHIVRNDTATIDKHVKEIIDWGGIDNRNFRPTLHNVQKWVSRNFCTPGFVHLYGDVVDSIETSIASKYSQYAVNARALKRQMLGWLPQIKKEIAAKCGRQASTSDDNVKQANEKLYDITGETGDQLVDKAHPGGGTKTEISSKTDENLVETIVEQQGKDLEVARSVPKGTYALLMNLHQKLSKMGYGKMLGTLDHAIAKVASHDEIVLMALGELAENLDKIGYEKQAKTVHDLKKKAFFDLALLGGFNFLYDRYFTPAAGTIADLKRRLQALDPRPGTDAARQIAFMISRLSSMAAYFTRSYATGDPKVDSENARKKLADLNNILPELKQMQESIRQMGARDEFADILVDVQRADESFTHAISGIESRIAEINKLYKSKPTVRTDYLERNIQEKKEKGVADKTTTRPGKKAPFRQRLVTDFELAQKFAKNYNAFLRSLDPRSDITAIHRMKIRRGRATEEGTFTEEFKQDVLRAFNDIMKAGGWKAYVAHMKEMAEKMRVDQEAGEIPLEEISQSQRIIGDGSMADVSKYHKQVADVVKQLAKLAYRKSREWIGIDLKNPSLSVSDVNSYLKQFETVATNVVRTSAPYTAGVMIPSAGYMIKDFRDQLRKYYGVR